MDSLTDAVVFLNDKKLPTDAFGNNVAFSCPHNCGYPVLILTHDENQRGMSEENPAECRGCGCKYWTTHLIHEEGKIIIQSKKK